MINPQTVVQASLNKDAKDRVDILERAFARLDWEVPIYCRGTDLVRPSIVVVLIDPSVYCRGTNLGVSGDVNKDAKDRVDILERAFARLDWEVCRTPIYFRGTNQIRPSIFVVLIRSVHLFSWY